MNIHLGIFKIINRSSNILLLFDKNLIELFEVLLKKLKNISGIFSGLFLSTFKIIVYSISYCFGIEKVLNIL